MFRSQILWKTACISLLGFKLSFGSFTSTTKKGYQYSFNKLECALLLEIYAQEKEVKNKRQVNPWQMKDTGQTF